MDTSGCPAGNRTRHASGRPRKERTPEFARLAALWEQGQITARAAARQLGISHTTFLQWTRELQQER